MVLAENKSFLLTFDVEDWFQVENFKDYIPHSSWDRYQMRVEKNTHKILNLLDSFDFKPKATFFVLGWIARKVPKLVQEIKERGHEIASHGLNHQLADSKNFDDLVTELTDSKKLLEHITGSRVYGYRAPSFSIDKTVLKAVKKSGYLYDSSYNSFSMHERYGILDLKNKNHSSISHEVLEDFFELPISNLTIGKKVFPLGGGGYFRLLPLFLFKSGIQNVLKKQDAFMFYSHPWEFDPAQPRVSQASINYKFRHYVNLQNNEKKLYSMIQGFKETSFITCSEYLTEKRNKNEQ